MKNLFKKFSPVLYIILVWFIFSAPYFIKHQVPYPSTYQATSFEPWSESGVYQGPVKNGAMPDVIDEIVPWKHFTIESLKRGELPLWNPNSFAGTPHLADYQSAVFSPFNLVFFILPFVDAWSIVVLLQPLLAGMFMYIFLREVKRSQIGSLLGSIAFMFSGFIVTWMAYGTLSMAIAFLPLALFAVEKGFKPRVIPTVVEGSHTSKQQSLSGGVRFLGFARNDIYLLLLPLSIAISFFSGHFQISLYFALYLLAYIVFKAATTKNSRASLLTGSFYILGILISLLQILPTLELYKLAARSELFSNAGAIPLHYLITMIAPDFYGNPVTRNDWIGYYAEWASFIGIIPFTFANVGVFLSFLSKRSASKDISLRQDQARIFFFFIAGLVCLLLAVDTPLQKVLVALKLPIFSTSIPSRIIILVSFSFAVLAGFGFDAVNELRGRSIKKLFAPLTLIVAVFISILTSLFVFHALPKDKAMLAAHNFVVPMALFVVTGIIVFFHNKFKKSFVPFALGCLILLLMTGDSLRFAQKWMPFDARELFFPSVPVIEAMQKNIGTGRAYGDYGAFVDTYYNLPSIDGYDPLYNKRYGEFIQSASTGEFVNAQRSIVSLDKKGNYTERVLDLLGVTTIFHPISRTNQKWAFPVWSKPEKYAVIYHDANFQLFRNRTALPHAKLFYSYEVISDDTAIIKRFYSEKFDFRNIIILEETPKLTLNKELKTKNRVQIVSYSPNKVVIAVSTEKPGVLFLSDSYYPRWKVKVNGKEEKIYRADYAFRAVVVPQGKSTVEFYYSGLF